MPGEWIERHLSQQHFFSYKYILPSYHVISGRLHRDLPADAASPLLTPQQCVGGGNGLEGTARDRACQQQLASEFLWVRWIIVSDNVAVTKWGCFLSSFKLFGQSSSGSEICRILQVGYMQSLQCVQSCVCALLVDAPACWSLPTLILNPRA